MFAGRHLDRSHVGKGGEERCAGCMVLWGVVWSPPDGNEPWDVRWR